MRKTLPLAALLGILLLVAQTGAGDASRRAGPTIQVHPGQLQRALERAGDGDTLVIHQGRYRGAFVITDRLRLTGARGERRPVIDGRCATHLTLAVRHSGVVLHRLEVIGADEGFGPFPSEVDFHNVASGRASELLVRDTCDAEYGINVFNSREVEVVGNRGRGFSDAAIYVGAITSTGDGVLRVAGNNVYRNNRGIIVEDSAGGRIRLVANTVHDNTAAGEGDPTGIFLHNGDQVLLKGNAVASNGVYGVHLDAGSERNRLFQNVAAGNPRGDFRDDGSGNCGSRNMPNAFPPC